MTDRVQAALCSPPFALRPSRTLALVAALGLFAALSLGGCRSHRSLEELEAALAPVGVPMPAAEDDDPLGAGFARVVRLFAAGAAPLEPPWDVDVRRGRVADRLVSLDAGRCYSFVAFATPSTVDIDLVLEDPDAQRVAMDTAPDAFPVLSTYCPQASGTFALRLRTVRGEGRARVGAYRVDEGEQNVVAQRVAALRDAHLPEGTAASALARAYLTERGAYDAPVAAIPGRCLSAVAVNGQGVTDLDAAWVLEDGTEPVRDVSLESVAVLTPLCVDRAQAVRLRLSARAGAGTVWWQVFESALP